MNALRSVMRLRRATLSKVFAALLVILAVSPFTAPFSTYDFAEPDGRSGVHHGILSADKIDGDKSTTHPDAWIAVPHVSAILLENTGTSYEPDKRQALPIVLRL
jgi:hypothetical protein